VTNTKFATRVALVLGAGASRDVSYADLGGHPSPLDCDFFDLLQRLKPTKKDASAVEFVLKQLDSISHECRRSMERTFYTLHLRAFLAHRLGVNGEAISFTEEEIVGHFARSVQALLRKSHGRQVCSHHVNILDRLRSTDTVVTFNYDLVVERAIRQVAAKGKIRFGQWLYNFERQPDDANLPLVLKLHGSSNWRLQEEEDKFAVLTKKWDDFDEAPGYLGHLGRGTHFPIFLPFWEKRIEEEPWLSLWKTAFNRLRKARALLVWGYSLPPTDVKAQELFSLAFQGRALKLCVIDISDQTRTRWREFFPQALYWSYHGIQEFLASPPEWWRMKSTS
jgi:hypothetical protein